MVYLAIFIVIAVIVVANIRIVPQARAYVIERLGTYQGTWPVGIHIKMPLIDRIARNVNIKEQVLDFPPQPVITKDNITMQIDTVIFYQITDPKLSKQLKNGFVKFDPRKGDNDGFFIAKITRLF